MSIFFSSDFPTVACVHLLCIIHPPLATHHTPAAKWVAFGCGFGHMNDGSPGRSLVDTCINCSRQSRRLIALYWIVEPFLSTNIYFLGRQRLFTCTSTCSTLEPTTPTVQVPYIRLMYPNPRCTCWPPPPSERQDPRGLIALLGV